MIAIASALNPSGCDVIASLPIDHLPSVILNLSLKKGPRLCRFRLELHLFLDLGGRYVATARTRPVGSHLPIIMFVGDGGCRGYRTLQGTVTITELGRKIKSAPQKDHGFLAGRIA